MDENQDVGGSPFEDRIRALFEDGTSWRNVSATAVVRGARRRRMRHRATAAGASFAVVGVATAGVVAFGGHSGGPSRAMGISGVVTAPTSSSSSVSTPVPPSSSSTSVATTCSASVTGTVPAPAHTTADGLDFETVSGSTAGIPWSVQIHAFHDWPSWLDWRKTQTDPPAPSTQSHVLGPPALIRQAGKPQFTMQSIPHYYFSFAGTDIGPSKTYLVVAYVAPSIDHLCVQYAHHADFEPVYPIQGDNFAVVGYTTADEPQSVTAYDAAGHVVSKSEGRYGLLPADGR